MTIRVGNGLDVHAFVDGASTVDATSAASPGRILRLAGVEIPDGQPLAGHSDADVVTHAVTDAVLGALALGDLGSRFGTDRPEFAGASSLLFLEEVIDEITSAGWKISNLDVTVVAQHPRLAPYREAMRGVLAETCRVDHDEVSVKLTTTDRLGTIGRREGIAAWATCVVVRVPR